MVAKLRLLIILALWRTYHQTVMIGLKYVMGFSTATLSLLHIFQDKIYYRPWQPETLPRRNDEGLQDPG